MEFEIGQFLKYTNDKRGWTIVEVISNTGESDETFTGKVIKTNFEDSDKPGDIFDTFSKELFEPIQSNTYDQLIKLIETKYNI